MYTRSIVKNKSSKESENYVPVSNAIKLHKSG